MRLFLIIEETRFYHPDFIANFLKKTKDHVVGAALVTKVSAKNNLENYLIKNWHYLKLFEMIKLFVKKNILFLQDVICKKRTDAPFYSVRSVFDFFNIDFFEVEYNINQKKYLDKIRGEKPDVIISSNPLIFKKELLYDIPNICCINRHSALLPSYGGVLPVFQAYRNEEQYTGVSVHVMESKIDNGAVLTQGKVRIEDTNTLSDLYEKCFAISADLVIEALEKVRNNDFTSCAEKKELTYFSFPTGDQWKVFRRRGGRFI